MQKGHYWASSDFGFENRFGKRTSRCTWVCANSCERALVNEQEAIKEVNEICSLNMSLESEKKIEFVIL